MAAAAPTAPPEPTVEPSSDAPTSIANRYAIGRFLGRGGRKDVYLALDEEAGREVAVALFSTEGMGQSALARARREIASMEKLGESPHLVGVLDTGEIDGRPYIVSRYMAGGDVQKLLAASSEKHLDPSRAVEIAIDVCRALEHAHACGVVHRDIKPANVWLASDGAARLGDFGLAVDGGGSSAGGALVGTVAYLPPEQALGRPSGPHSDLYSLGALLYEMVAGVPPFIGDNAVSIIGQHLNAEPVSASVHNPDVTPALDRAIATLLAKSPDDRPESAKAARELLEAARDAPPEPEGEAIALNPLEALAGGIFVGRDAELERLRRAADEALSGHGRLVLMAGEPGIGKTRTAEELATYAQINGARVLWGRCHEGEGAPAYWPWMQAIRAYVREADPVALAWELGAGATDIGRVVPEVAERIGDGTSVPPDPNDEAARFRFFDSVGSFLASAAVSRPLVIVIDDLHWADEPSLLLLRFLSSSLASSSLLIIGTYRDVEVRRGHPLSGALRELSAARDVSRVQLRGLDEPAVARYLEMTTGESADPGLAEAVFMQTDGNPFFVSEVVRLLAAEGRLGESELDVSGSIPEGVRDVVGRRVDRLSPEANKLLGIAAVLGRSFEREALERVSGVPADAVAGALGEAERAEILTDLNRGRFRFSHALVRETLYEEHDSNERPRMHARIATELESYYGADERRLERHLAEIAHHFNEAGANGDPHKAIEYGCRAGEAAARDLGYEDAAEHFARALEASELTNADGLERCHLLLRLGEAQTNAGRLGDALVTYLDAAERAISQNADPELVEAALGAAKAQVIGSSDEKMIWLLERALDATSDPAECARLFSRLGQMYYWSDPQGRSREFHEKAVEAARRSGDDQALAFALGNSLFNDTGPGVAEQTLVKLEEVGELARRAGAREEELRTHINRVRCHLDLGDMRSFDHELATYSKLAADLRQPQVLWRTPLIQATRAMVEGRLEKAEKLAAEARAGGERAQEPIAQQFFAAQISALYRVQGRVGDILPMVEALSATYSAIPAWRSALGVIYSLLDRHEDARREFELLAVDDFTGIPEDAQLLMTLCSLAEVAAALEDAERSEILHERLVPYADLNAVAGPAAGFWGPVARYLGLLSHTAGRFDDAVGEFEKAIAMSDRMGERPYRALALANLARVLLKRDGAGDHDRAIELLDASLAESQEIGMRAVTQRALATKLEAQGLSDVDATTSIDDVIAAVESERPDVRSYAAPDGSVTILFSDIESSTLMTERLGDERWIELLRSHNTIFRDRLAEHGGFEVKNQGDGFMLVFPDPVEALRCAVEVQADFEARAEEAPDERIRVRMGLHTGEAIAEEGDFFGRNVILAARIAAKALGGEVLVSEDLRQLAADAGDLSFDGGRELELKGMAGSHRAFRLQWQQRPALI